MIELKDVIYIPIRTESIEACCSCFDEVIMMRRLGDYSSLSREVFHCSYHHSQIILPARSCWDNNIDTELPVYVLRST